MNHGPNFNFEARFGIRVKKWISVNTVYLYLGIFWHGLSIHFWFFNWIFFKPISIRNQVKLEILKQYFIGFSKLYPCWGIIHCVFDPIWCCHEYLTLSPLHRSPAFFFFVATTIFHDGWRTKLLFFVNFAVVSLLSTHTNFNVTPINTWIHFLWNFCNRAAHEPHLFLYWIRGKVVVTQLKNGLHF